MEEGRNIIYCEGCIIICNLPTRQQQSYDYSRLRLLTSTTTASSPTYPSLWV